MDLRSLGPGQTTLTLSAEEWRSVIRMAEVVLQGIDDEEFYTRLGVWKEDMKAFQARVRRLGEECWAQGSPSCTIRVDETDLYRLLGLLRESGLLAGYHYQSSIGISLQESVSWAARIKPFLRTCE